MKQDVKKVGVLHLSLAIAFVLAYSVCAVPCAQVEETSTDTKFMNVKDGMEVLKRFVVSLQTPLCNIIQHFSLCLHECVRITLECNSIHTIGIAIMAWV